MCGLHAQIRFRVVARIRRGMRAKEGIIIKCVASDSKATSISQLCRDVVDTLRVPWVAKRVVRKVSPLEPCMPRAQQAFVDRKRAIQARLICQVKSLPEAGIAVIFFPEGTWMREGSLQSFELGRFAVAVEVNVPVVAVLRSRMLWPPGGVDMRSGGAEVVVGEPIPMNPHLAKKAARENPLSRVQDIVAARLPEEASLPVTAPTPIPAPSGFAISERSAS